MATDTRALTTLREAQLERVQERARGEELLAHIERNMAAITDAFYEIGVALTELNNNRLYLSLGYRSFAELLEKRRFMSQTQANKLIAVATLVPREAAVRLGPEKSYALTRYARVASHPGGVAGLIDAGRVEGRPLEAVTVRDLAEFTRDRRGPRSAGSGSVAAEARRTARSVQAALRKRGLDGVSVEAVARGGKRFRVTVSREQLEALAARW